jgi:hypothetical protein
MLGWVAMARSCQKRPERGESRHPLRAVVKTGVPRADTDHRTGFCRPPRGNVEQRKVVTVMMFAVLLLPLGLLAVLLGMERLERWTVDDGEETESERPVT